jgi:hypothetical protein
MANTVTTLKTRIFIGETTLWLGQQPITKAEYQAKKDAWLALDAEEREKNPLVRPNAQVNVHFKDDVENIIAWNDDMSAKTVAKTRILSMPQGTLKAMLLQDFDKACDYQDACRGVDDAEKKWEIFCQTFRKALVEVKQERVPVGGTHDGGVTPYSREAFHTTLTPIEEE